MSHPDTNRPQRQQSRLIDDTVLLASLAVVCGVLVAHAGLPLATAVFLRTARPLVDVVVIVVLLAPMAVTALAPPITGALRWERGAHRIGRIDERLRAA